MATTIRDLLVKIGVEADTDQVEAFDEALEVTVNTMVAAAAAAAAFAAALVGIAVSTAAAGDEIAKNSAKVGISGEAYQELAFAAERSGTSIDQVTTALKRQAASAADAATGTGEATKAFERLGVSVTDVNGDLKSQEDLLAETFDALSNVENETERLALTQDIYGRSAGELLPLINQGADGLEAFAAEARALGIILDEETLAASEAFADNLQDTRAIVTGLKNVIGAALLPVLNELLDRFAAWFVANQDVIASGIEAWVNDLIAVIRDIVAFVDDVVELFGGWENVLLAVGAAISAVVAAWAAFQVGTAVSAAITAIGSLVTLGTAAIPVVTAVLFGIAELIALLAVLGLVLEDVLVFLDGGRSVTGQLWDEMQRGEGVLGALGDVIVQFMNLLEATLLILEAFAPVLEVIGSMLRWVFDEIGVPLLELFGQGVLMLIEGNLRALSLFLNRLAREFMTLAMWAEQLISLGGEAIDVVSGALGAAGIDIGLGGSAAAATSGLVPSAAAVGGATTTTTSNQNVSVGGASIVINGAGLTQEEVQQAISDALAEQNRQLAAATGSQEI